MISYLYPPNLEVGGIRASEFAKNLSDLGWKVDVLTAYSGKKRNKKKNINVHYAKRINFGKFFDYLDKKLYFGLKKIGIKLKKEYFKEIFLIPDDYLFWKILSKGVRLAKKNDIIYVSCSPFSSSILSVIIKKLSHKPLVCDFRDAWTLNPYNRKIKIVSWINKQLEKFVLRNTDFLIVNTHGTKKLYQDYYPSLKIKAIPNGYDSIIKKEPNKNEFVILYLGSFYVGREPDLLFKAISRVNKNIKIIFVGPSEYWVNRSAKRCGFDINKIQLLSRLPREKAFEHFNKSTLLYLNQGSKKGSAYTPVAAKTYEYLSTGLPILAEVPEGDNAEIIRKYSPHSYVITSGNFKDMKNAINDAYTKWEKKMLKSRISKDFISKFNRKRLTKELEQIFEQVIK